MSVFLPCLYLVVLSVLWESCRLSDQMCTSISLRDKSWLTWFLQVMHSVPGGYASVPGGCAKIRLVMLEVIIMVLFQVVIQLLVGRELFWQLKDFSRDSVLCFQQGKNTNDPLNPTSWWQKIQYKMLFLLPMNSRYYPFTKGPPFLKIGQAIRSISFRRI